MICFGVMENRTSRIIRGLMLKTYNTVDTGNRVAILALLDDVRRISRCVADIQMKN